MDREKKNRSHRAVCSLLISVGVDIVRICFFLFFNIGCTNYCVNVYFNYRHLRRNKRNGEFVFFFFILVSMTRDRRRKFLASGNCNTRITFITCNIYYADSMLSLRCCCCCLISFSCVWSNSLIGNTMASQSFAFWTRLGGRFLRKPFRSIICI